MRTNDPLAARDERGERAALRDRILTYGRRIGWPAHTAIVFTEQLTRRPWKRCTCAELSAVVDELRTILSADEARPRTVPTSAHDETVRSHWEDRRALDR